ncbi:MAG: ATP-binding protein [Candidatus Aenigmatarchaeota archaeon]
MQEIGTVITSETTPSTEEFWFVLNDNKEMPVRKHQFIQIQTKDGLLIARVEEIFKTNRYFSRAESVSEFERSGKPLIEQFPVDRWEYLIAKAFPLGLYVNGSQKRVSFPLSPGDRVYPIDEKILFEFLGLDKERGLNIGKVEFHEIESNLNITKLFQKHCSVLAQTGFGKSHFISILIEELLDRYEGYGRPAVIVIDPHGEYTGFSEDPHYMTKTMVFDKKNISIASNSLSEKDIHEFQPFITDVAIRELGKIIKQLKERKKVYNLSELIDAIESSNILERTKCPLISWLSELNDSHLFKEINKPTVEDLARAGQLSVLDLSEYINLQEKQIIVAYFARRLFNARRQNRIPPFILMIEESHQFAPESEDRSNIISKGIIETIAREGRKFHACLVLISQRPVQLSTTALSQCNSNIILRISNPYDLDHVGKSCEGVTGSVLKMLPGLKVGEALITGEVVNYPLLVKVRDRKSKKSDKGIKLEDALIKYNSEKKLQINDLDTFM